MCITSLTSSCLANVRRAPVLASSIAILLISGTFAEAGNIWDGGGGDDNWGTGNNWNPNGSPGPGSGNDLFFAGTTRLTPFNNYTPFDDWRHVTFNAGAGSFNITGNAIDLFGKIENLSTNSQTAGFVSIALNSATLNEFNPVNGNLTITSTNIFTNGNQLKVFGNNGFSLSFSSGTNIQQAGSVAINQNSTVIYNSAHSYTGDTFINAGALQFNSGASAASSIIRVGDTSGVAAARLSMASGATVNSTVVVRPGSSGTKTISSLATSGTGTVSGGVFLDADVSTSSALGGTLAFTAASFDLKNQRLTVEGTGATTISSALGNSVGSGKLTKNDSGILSLTSGSNNYSGGTTVNGGLLAVNNASGSGAGTGSVTVNNGGTIGGNGFFTGNAIINSGGAIAPGNSIGSLDTGSLSLTSANASFEFELDLGVLDADLLNVTGTITLGGGNLDLSLLNAPLSLAFPQTFLIASNDLSEAVNGTFGSFTGLPAGYGVIVDYDFLGTDSLGRIGDGNDIALKIVPEPATAVWGLAVSLLAFGRRSRARRQSTGA